MKEKDELRLHKRGGEEGGVETQYSRARGKKRREKSNQYFTEKTQQKYILLYYILGKKKRKDERGTLEAPKAERTKDGERALGGLE